MISESRIPVFVMPANWEGLTPLCLQGPVCEQKLRSMEETSVHNLTTGYPSWELMTSVCLVCLFMWAYVCMRVYMCVCMCAVMCINVCLRLYMHVYVCVWCVCMWCVWYVQCAVCMWFVYVCVGVCGM